ncbi:hypothetical protein [Paenibacillus alvei]|uniref:hypothetical protein n=1 Tax=Paenibacillus TaxID=44249 RepID=UPI000385A3F8|nr:hypothetical protein [Paenibacillus alvei]EPY10387.1 hypothetical protein PAAL66ix_24615 [Paenibacillus alvei A6-6i-x]
MNKIISSSLALLLLFLIMPQFSFADNELSEMEKKEFLSATGLDNFFTSPEDERLFFESNKDFDFKNAKRGSTQTSYFRYEIINFNDVIENGEEPIVQTTVVTEEEALKSLSNKIYSGNSSTLGHSEGEYLSWIKFELLSVPSDSEIMYLAQFRWLKTPYYKLTDHIAIGVSNNLSIKPGSSYATYSREVYYEGSGWEGKSDTFKSPKTEAGGYYYPFRLVQSGSQKDLRNVMGSMLLRAEKRNFNAPVQAYDGFAAYVHEELGFSVSISIPLGGSIGVSGTHDKATAHVVDRF